jgi:hypothetical protein
VSAAAASIVMRIIGASRWRPSAVLLSSIGLRPAGIEAREGTDSLDR